MRMFPDRKERDTMAKHLTLEERNIIAQRLNEGCSFKAIANELGKSCTTISREIRTHLIFKKVGSQGRAFNACKHRFVCREHHICDMCSGRKSFSYCKNCKFCNSVCSRFEAEVCPNLSNPPYVFTVCTNPPPPSPPPPRPSNLPL